MAVPFIIVNLCFNYTKHILTKRDWGKRVKKYEVQLIFNTKKLNER